MPSISEKSPLDIALATFRQIQELFPRLRMHVDTQHEHVDVAVDIPKQEGLDFPVHLNLQNVDELHLVVGSFWLEWFPCTNPSRVEAYIDAVQGILVGRYRVVEHVHGSTPVKAELQCPNGSDWVTIGTSGFAIPWPWRRYRIIQNAAHDASSDPKLGQE